MSLTPEFCLMSLALFVPNNSEWVASPSPSNIRLRGAKLGWGRKNLIKILTFQQLRSQCFQHFLTQCHSPPPKFIQNQAPIHHPSHQLYAHCLHWWKKVYPMLQKTKISLMTSHCIFVDFNIKTTQQEVMERSPFIVRKYVLKPVSVWLYFPKQQK